MIRLKSFLGVAASVAACELVGGAGAVLSADGINHWYPTLRKPRFNPPSWVFGPVWTVLYAAMGTAAYLVGRRRATHPAAHGALALFGAQLMLNGLWSPAFFGLRSPRAGMAVIAGMWVTIAATVLAFARVSRAAALLMLPYLAWTSFAALLNAAIWRLNRGATATGPRS